MLRGKGRPLETRPGSSSRNSPAVLLITFDEVIYRIPGTIRLCGKYKPNRAVGTTDAE